MAGKYRLQRRIGGGSFGAVYIGNGCGRRSGFMRVLAYIMSDESRPDPENPRSG